MSSLFHFTKTSTLIDYILPAKSIKTNSLKTMNDPRESQLWGFGGVNIAYDKIFSDYSYSNHAVFQYKLGNLIKDNLQVICFTESREGGWNNEMMWAHYADNHAGVCLEFDEDQLLNNIQEALPGIKYYLEGIIYTSGKSYVQLIWNKLNTTQQNINDNIASLYKEIVFQKSHYWGKENEKRLVILDTQSDILIPIKKALKAIYLGLAFSYDQLLSLENQLNSDVCLYDIIYQHNRHERWLRKPGCTKIPITRRPF